MDHTFRDRFRNASPQELVDALNREVGNPGWGTARGFYLAALREAFLASGLDCSSFIEGGMSLIRVRLDGNKVVPIAEARVAEAPTPALEPVDPPPAGAAVDLEDEQSVIDPFENDRTIANHYARQQENLPPPLEPHPGYATLVEAWVAHKKWLAEHYPLSDIASWPKPWATAAPPQSEPE